MRSNWSIMKSMMILMTLMLTMGANTKSTDTNVVGMMMASKLSPSATHQHPTPTAAIDRTARQSSETINFMQPEADTEKKPERWNFR